ncbi:gas vesicle protein GvpG [Priestia megaterium]|uniref:gas vesicle protein GvpG n=1 Tax=Priestia megaterium TaxID=1404 RepID=UPI00240E5EF2|nr:gas vesicle protein GvpG [Priestia megaterium]MCJ7989840.1 gas vesicle protein GvpG [Priestia sp. OVS21]MED4062385.1 gas vesicle protein GvpG [Priestia megaterium]WEZ39252.1 gas vesicle protein GvpG [Priestia megaterium DSM 319]
MLHKLVTAPINLVVKIGEKVQEEADKQLYDLPTIQQKLIQLQMMFELGEIPEEAFQEKEDELLMRYEIAKRREIEQWEELTKKEMRNPRWENYCIYTV